MSENIRRKRIEAHLDPARIPGDVRLRPDDVTAMVRAIRDARQDALDALQLEHPLDDVSNELVRALRRIVLALSLQK